MRRAVPIVDCSRAGGIPEPLANKALSRPSSTDQGTSLGLLVMVTITVRPILRYLPISILCEKRPERSFPTSLTPFSLATLLALASSKEGLAEVSMLNVLAMPVTYH